jgi:hypothetical protein
MYNWLLTTTRGWLIGIIASGEQAEAGTAIAAEIFANNSADVYYLGASSKVYDWYFNTEHWHNEKL